MFALRKETKFNYGLLLFGAAMPPLADAILGPKWGLLGLVVIACIGLGLLVSGHFHREDGETETRLKRSGRFVFLGGVFALAIIAIPWAIKKGHRSEPVEALSPQMSPAETGEVANFFRGEENELREKFAYPSMLATNVKMIAESWRHFEATGKKDFDWSPYATGETFMDNRYGTVRRYGGSIQFWLDPESVGILVLPRKYAACKKVLKDFEHSPDLPDSVIQEIKDFDAATDANTSQLLTVLHDKSKENRAYFIRYDDFSSAIFFHKLDEFWFAHFEELRPKADRVVVTLRDFRMRH